MPTNVDKLIEAGHDINSFGPAVLAQLVQAGILTVNEARRALRLPPKSYQEAGEKVLYNGSPAEPEMKVIPKYTKEELHHVAMAQALGVPLDKLQNAISRASEAPPSEVEGVWGASSITPEVRARIEAENQKLSQELDEKMARPQKTVYRPTTPPKRGRPPQPNWTSKYPPSQKQIGLLKYLVKEAELPITVLDALAVEEARRSGGADAKFVTGWYAMSGKIASRVIDRLKQESPEAGDEDEEEFGKF